MTVLDDNCRDVFVEHPDTLPDSFYALVETVKREAAKAVVLPGRQHLVVGDPDWMTQYLQKGTGALLLGARHSP